MSYALCTVPAAPVRGEAAHRSEMTSQLLFGEAVEILEESGEWLRIRSLYDGYEGWVTNHVVEETPAAITGSYVASGLINEVQWRGSMLRAPMGSTLAGLGDGGVLWDGRSFYAGQWRDVSKVDASLILPLAVQWLNAPYLWGGKTMMGVDCSGFVQTVFKVAGIPLLRDAWQQAGGGEAVASLSEAQPRDLAFFHNDKSRVTHVGILINDKEIIHASGRVRIDTLTEEGIISRTSGKLTHPLHSVRKYV